jgi:hypothetical protein
MSPINHQRKDIAGDDKKLKSYQGIASGHNEPATSCSSKKLK